MPRHFLFPHEGWQKQINPFLRGCCVFIVRTKRLTYWPTGGRTPAGRPAVIIKIWRVSRTQDNCTAGSGSCRLQLRSSRKQQQQKPQHWAQGPGQWSAHWLVQPELSLVIVRQLGQLQQIAVACANYTDCKRKLRQIKNYTLKNDKRNFFVLWIEPKNVTDMWSKGQKLIEAI